MKNQKENQKPKSKSILPEAEFYGTAAVGTKGQIVIPKEAREKYGLKAKDKVVVFGGEGGVLAIIKADQMNELLAKVGGSLIN